MFNFIKEEIKNAVTKKIIIFSLLIFFINSAITFIIPNKNYLSAIIISIVSSISVILIFISAEIASKDYKYNTYKYVYTGSFSRTKIILLKLATMITIAILCAAVGGIMLIIAINIDYKSMNFKEIIKVILNLQMVFIVYTLVITSTSLLILVISKNYIITVVTTYIIFFDLFTPLILNGIDKIENNILRVVLKNIPYLYATMGAKELYYSWEKVCIMLFYSIIVIGVTIFIFEKRDL